MSIDFDTIPIDIRNSRVLTKQMIDMLLSVDAIPQIDPSFNDDRLKSIVQYYSVSPSEMEKELHIYAAELLNKGSIYAAWQILLSIDNLLML